MRTCQNVLVTGGCGFIGSAFIRRTLADEGFSGALVNLDALTYAGSVLNLPGADQDPRYTFCEGRIQDRALVEDLCREHSIDTLVHFAAESHVDRSIDGPAEFIDTNILGTFSLLEAVRKLGNIHFHHVSTDEVYGSLGETGLFHETTAYDPRSPYSASKAASDHLVRAYGHTYGVSFTLSNCSNNYGPFQFPEKLIPLMTLNCFNGKALPIYGDGKNVRDWLYVDDHVDAIWLVVRKGKQGESYNIGGDCELKNLDLIKQLIEIVAECTDQTVEEISGLMTFVEDRAGHDRRYAIDFSRIQGELGWSPAHSFATGLSETVKWYQQNPEWIEAVSER